MPVISANFLITADGKVSTRTLTPSGFSATTDDHRRLKKLRAGADALLVGRRTVEVDDMTMGGAVTGHYPRRMVYSPTAALDPATRLLHTDGGPVHVICGDQVKAETADALTTWGVAIDRFPDPTDLRHVITQLAETYSLQKIHCEGGPGLFKLLCEHDLIDELHLTITNRIFGGHAAPTLTGNAAQPLLPASLQFELTHHQQIGDDVFLSYRRTR
ncbi:RibD family protein [Sulfuriroseicoccus oceanibius]|uniref:RibD family protein n=1 Tax=Sulfuriroseicoccus oceanibius TaxID=2707525 RepID=A0A6B3L4U8_9BACT|nr:RibD family protein [Sulfuriroseicoccus oceanibius]QQL43835.1 RibD family protein [Sulfuriroseicoccus oceanibius]